MPIQSSYELRDGRKLAIGRDYEAMPLECSEEELALVLIFEAEDGSWEVERCVNKELYVTGDEAGSLFRLRSGDDGPALIARGIDADLLLREWGISTAVLKS